MSSARHLRLALALLVVAYLVPGLIGHEPWKPDEPYTFGVVRTMLASHDWLVPSVGGLPFVEKPPLYYWIAAAALEIFSPWLPPHDAARLATTFLVLLTLAATAGAARLCWGSEAEWPAVLLFLATLGLEGHAQRMQVDHALMAGFALAVLGLAAYAQRRRWSGVVLGLGVAMGFLAKGLIAPAVIGLSALLLPAFFREWRSGRYARELACAAAVAVPAMVVWPLLLWLRDAALFDEWFWENNVGRFAGTSLARLGATSEPNFWQETLPWFLFPLWVYALGSLRQEGARAWHDPGMQLGLTLSFVMLLVLFTSASGRAVYALPLLPPMVLVSIAAARRPEGGVAGVFSIVAIGVALLSAVLFWGIWADLMATGGVPAWTRLGDHFPLPFEMPFQPWSVAAAASMTAAFAAIAITRKRWPASALMLWTGAVALSWGLAMTLWLPWFDAAKGYREVFTEAARHLPPGTRCIVVRRVGEGERAMVEYYMGVPPRSPGKSDMECAALLWEGNPVNGKERPSPPQWRSLWKGSRPGERAEAFELFEPARAE